MQPINLSISLPVSESCDNWSCCFPRRKSKKDKTAQIAEEQFQKQETKKEEKIDISKLVSSDKETPAF
jgi:hypothetical protein